MTKFQANFERTASLLMNHLLPHLLQNQPPVHLSKFLLSNTLRNSPNPKPELCIPRASDQLEPRPPHLSHLLKPATTCATPKFRNSSTSISLPRNSNTNLKTRVQVTPFHDLTLVPVSIVRMLHILQPCSLFQVPCSHRKLQSLSTPTRHYC